MLTSNQQLIALEVRNKAQFNKVSELDLSAQKPPRHPSQFEDSKKKRHQKEENINKVSLPSLPNIKKMDIGGNELLPKQNMINYGNGLRIQSRLPKLEPKSEIPRPQYRSNDPGARHHPEESPQYQSVTPERRQQQSPDRQQLTINKKRLLAKTCGLGQFSHRTKPGCLPNKTIKTNQDSAITFPSNIEQLGYNLVAICDGHGLNGHLVSQFIKQALPKYIEYHLEENNIRLSLIKAFEQTNKEIWNSEVDTALSGSTTVALLCKRDQDVIRLWSANVGDSRAILCRNQDGWRAIELSIDQKPSRQEEKQRIINFGGRVECQKDFYGNSVGPERVWLQYVDAPGLAMTRSMGDKIGAQAGVIAEPEILEFTTQPSDKFIVIASDGVWEYLTNEEVMQVVIPYYEKENIDLAADRVVAESIAAWKRHSLSRDDITCVVVYLK
ncbi:hypothetical protein pb186bvf_008773 [Paramecium bursaria]